MARAPFLPLAAQVSRDAPLREAALAIGATIGGAGGALFKAVFGAPNLSYGDAWVIGSAAGVGVVVLYLLI